MVVESIIAYDKTSVRLEELCFLRLCRHSISFFFPVHPVGIILKNMIING